MYNLFVDMIQYPYYLSFCAKLITVLNKGELTLRVAEVHVCWGLPEPKVSAAVCEVQLISYTDLER